MGSANFDFETFCLAYEQVGKRSDEAGVNAMG
jgi:hypothetical protein